MLANVGRRVGRAGRALWNAPAPVRAGVGLLGGGPIGAAAAVGIPGAARTGTRLATARELRRGTLTGPLTSALQGSRFRNNRMLGTMARHPVMTGIGAASMYSYYNNLPGPQRSARNQNSRYLRQVRRHQRSSALSQVIGSSSGAYA